MARLLRQDLLLKEALGDAWAIKALNHFADIGTAELKVRLGIAPIEELSDAQTQGLFGLLEHKYGDPNPLDRPEDETE
jgi:hypothetical protein